MGSAAGPPAFRAWRLVRELRAKGLLFPSLALVALALVLIQGALSGQPAQHVSTTSASKGPPPSEAPGRPDLEKAPLAYLSDYWLQLGNRVRQCLVRVGPQGAPGVLLAPDLALTALPPAGETGASAPLAVDPDLGVALFQLATNSGGAPLATVDPNSLRPATLVAAVALAPDGGLEITPAYLTAAPTGETHVDLQLSTLPRPPPKVAAVVDLDGRLVGGMFAGAEGPRLFWATELAAAAERLRRSPPCHAIQAASLDEAARKLLGVRGGVVVSWVRSLSFGGQAPLREGDVLLEWNGQAVGDVEGFDALQDAAPPGGAVEAVVWRSRRRLALNLVLPGRDCRPAGEPPVSFRELGLTLRWSEPRGETAGWRVMGLEPEGPGAKAGLRDGDRLVAINGLELTRQSARELDSLIAAPRPVLLRVRRDSGASLHVLTPPGAKP
jgi:membrane-associated protease RseP (regulator of RpoE activity)